MISHRRPFKNLAVILLLLNHSVKLVKCFVIFPHHHTVTRLPVSSLVVVGRQHHLPLPNSMFSKKTQWKMPLLMAGGDDRQIEDDNTSNSKSDGYSKPISIFASLSALAWILVSVTALSYHPDPKFQDCTMRHNILTMSQAFAFPLPVGWAAIAGGSLSLDSTISSPMNLGITLASLWLACSCGVYAPKFAFGYDLYSVPLKFGVTTVNTITAILAVLSWKKSLPTKTKQNSIGEVFGSIVTLGSSLWGVCTLGLLFFTILPIVSPYPMATVPTILGKRLSRPASAFTFLGSVCTYILHVRKRPNETNNNSNNEEESSSSLIKIRKGLLIGSSFHVTLLALKLIGVDGGGLILPGRGLWEVYPAMLAVPLATASSIALHLLVCIAAVMN